MNALKAQYLGFIQTPFLWLQNEIFELQQFEKQTTKPTSFQLEIQQKLRLGKLVERFVSFELAQNSSIKILAENIQIQKEKTTLGELDCLLLKDEQLVHLEIVYKFYLYDATVSNEEINRWIGPNRRDSLIQKVAKLKEKQLPLLYSTECRNYLSELNLSAEKIEQQVYFKAQLFVPFSDFGNTFPLVNNECIEGFYIFPKELAQFSDSKFYIPTKHNWLLKPHVNIDWLNFEQFKTQLQTFLDEENSPLCWMKKHNGEFVKFFVVAW